LEIFARDVAVALNTLDLLIAQKANTAQASVEAIHSAVALPVDEILNEAVTLIEQHPGQDSALRERLQRILRKARDIRQVIHRVGQSMTPSQAVPVGDGGRERPLLRGRRVLVVDSTDEMRTLAHQMLEPYGCSVETAHNGVEAVGMVRSLQQVGGHDIIISDIALPDMTGYDLMMRLQEFLGVVPPMILAKEYGYDLGHTVMKARQAGLHAKGIVIKPYRDPQLPDAMETIIEWTAAGGGKS
jgi:CheY-like chemotaxis protein